MSRNVRQKLARRASGIVGRINRDMPDYPVGVKHHTGLLIPNGELIIRPMSFCYKTKSATRKTEIGTI
jgi:hypothetical protein